MTGFLWVRYREKYKRIEFTFSAMYLDKYKCVAEKKNSPPDYINNAQINYSHAAQIKTKLQGGTV